MIEEKAKILLVDDREENLIALEAILSSLDQDLVRARSGEQALKALLTDEYAVILLDIVMPGMDGFETARDIKRRKKTRDVPIIFLTAVNSDPDYAFRGYAAGAVDFIAKPFDPWVLRAKVSVFVELHNKNRQLQEQAVLLGNRPPCCAADWQIRPKAPDLWHYHPCDRGKTDRVAVRRREPRGRDPHQPLGDPPGRPVPVGGRRRDRHHRAPHRAHG